MRSQKPYTNTTFTKRVDREAGRHRPARAPSEPRVCGTCGAVYRRRRWVTAEQAGPVAGTDPPPAVVTCPACRKIGAQQASGFLYLSGAYLATHRDEVVNLVSAEAKRAAEDNPTGRIIALEPAPDGSLVVTTTTEHLAERLGHALAKACDGDVRFDFSHENKLARVYWHRD
jgi:hypothetical protein